MEIREIKSRIKKVKCTRNHKINNSLGVYDAYKYIRKNKWFDIGRALTEKEFYKIVRLVNEELAELIVKGISVRLPNNMGTLELRKRKTIQSIVNGKLVTNLPIDWDSTLELWAIDEEAMNNRTLVRCENKDVYLVHYRRKDAKYKNKSFYKFSTNRQLKHMVTDNIKKGIIDSFLLYD